MPRKYRHIKLPRGLIGASAPRNVENSPNPQGLWPLTKQQEAERKERITEGLARIEEFGSRTTTTLPELPREDYYELKVSLRRGGNKDLLKRLNIEPYRKITEKVLEVGEGPEKKVFKEETFVGRVSTRRLEGEQYSNFDKLKQEMSGYINNGYLHSYYDAISDLEPLTIDQVAETGLLDDLNSSMFGRKLMVDVVFADDTETSAAKISSIESNYSESFILKVNTRLSHYCRMKLSKSEAEKLLKDYKGIVELTHAPVFITSEGSTSSSDEITVVDGTNSSRPIIVADEVISSTHPLLDGALVDRLGDTVRTGNHGTQVGSLVVYGKRIPKRGTAEQKNKIIGLSVLLTDPTTGVTTMNEPLIIDAVKSMNDPIRPLIINLSVNNAYTLYDRSTVSPVTILLDELSHDYNCMFVISAGNMDEVNDFYHQGIRYPDYYNLPNTSIFAPADSVNNLSVGAIAYQETSDSIAPRENPSPITRRGFEDKRFGFIKPDLVHYDSNCIPNGGYLEPEYNGPNVATGDTGTTNNIGTSFAAPLISHELGILASYYPTYRAQTLKGLLVHFAQIPDNIPTTMTPERVTSLLGHGQTRLDDALNSLNTASTIVVEDKIPIKSTKKLSIPIPSGLAGSHSLRLRIRATLAYSIPPNPKDASTYSPITLTAKVSRDDNHSVSTPTTQSYLRGAHKKSNLKKYPAIEKSTNSHTGVFWNIDICADPVGDFLADDYVQPYSLIVTIEDMHKDDAIDIHEEISQMIEVETHSTVDISV